MTSAADKTKPGTHPSEVWDRDHRALTVGLLATVAAAAFEALAVATALPSIVKEIGGLSLYGWPFSAFMLASLVGIVASGSLADRRGPAPPFIAGTTLFVLGLLAAGLANSMPFLIAARLLQGLGSGAIGSIAYVAVGRGYSADTRPRMIALLSSAWVVPGLIGPGIAGLVADTIGWRWVFYGLAPAITVGGLIATPSLRRLARSEARSENARAETRTRDALILATGAGLLLAGLEILDPLPTGILIAAGIALALPAARRLLPPGTLRIQPGLAGAVALIGIVGFGFFGAEAFIPLAITLVREQSATMAGLPLTAGTLCWALGAWIQAREANRRNRRTLVAWGFVLIAAGVAGTDLVLWPVVPVWATVFPWGIAALGMGIAYSTLALVILECASPGEEGRASAALQLSHTLCIALGTGLGGVILAVVTAESGTVSLAIGGVHFTMVVVLLLGALTAARIPATRAEARQIAGHSGASTGQPG